MQHGPYPTVPPDLGHWLAGFLDGEGCFYIRVTDRSDDPRHHRYGCVCQLRLRDDDLPALREIQAETGIGTITRTAERPPRHGYVTRAAAVWSINTKADVGALVELLDRYPLRSKKARDYAVWREAVKWWLEDGKRNGTHGPRDIAPLIAMKQRLAEAREYRHVAA